MKVLLPEVLASRYLPTLGAEAASASRATTADLTRVRFARGEHLPASVALVQSRHPVEQTFAGREGCWKWARQLWARAKEQVHALAAPAFVLQDC